MGGKLSEWYVKCTGAGVYGGPNLYVLLPYPELERSADNVECDGQYGRSAGMLPRCESNLYHRGPKRRTFMGNGERNCRIYISNDWQCRHGINYLLRESHCDDYVHGYCYKHNFGHWCDANDLSHLWFFLDSSG